MNKVDLENWCRMMTYYSHGDAEEKKHGTQFIRYFPKHEEFWRYIIVPSTNRIHNTSDISFRSDCPVRLQRIAQAHYSIFIHLNWVLNGASDIAPDYFSMEDCFSHLKSAFDIFDTMIFHLAILIHEEIKIKSDPDFDMRLKIKDEKELDNEYETKKKKYLGDYRHYLTTGKSLTFIFNDTMNVNSHFLKETIQITKAQSASLERLKKNIGRYRNYFIHNCILGKNITHSNIYIPKLDCEAEAYNAFIEKYSLWTNVFTASKDDDLLKKDFVNGKDLINEYLKATFDLLNDIWEKVLDFLLEEKSYEKLYRYFAVGNGKMEPAYCAQSVAMLPETVTDERSVPSHDMTRSLMPSGMSISTSTETEKASARFDT